MGPSKFLCLLPQYVVNNGDQDKGQIDEELNDKAHRNQEEHQRHLDGMKDDFSIGRFDRSFHNQSDSFVKVTPRLFYNSPNGIVKSEKPQS